MENYIFHKASTRGKADHGWLKSNFTFSFAEYYNPDRMHFGVLRVLNDDIIAGGMGFGNHPHDNMEIISVPVYGSIEHKDSMGNTYVIREDEVQIMSAGSGVFHSEYNHDKQKEANFLQIWLFPNEKNVKPRYDQKKFEKSQRINRLQELISPENRVKKEGLWLHQDAWFYKTILQKDHALTYNLNQKGNAVYLFVIYGKLMVNKIELESRDGLGITETETLDLNATEDCEILFMEFPLN